MANSGMLVEALQNLSENERELWVPNQVTYTPTPHGHHTHTGTGNHEPIHPPRTRTDYIHTTHDTARV